MKKYFFLFILQFLNANFCLSQQETQKRLEKEKAKLVSEIKQINSLLFSNNSIKKSAIDEIKDLDVKIKVIDIFALKIIILHEFKNQIRKQRRQVDQGTFSRWNFCDRTLIAYRQ